MLHFIFGQIFHQKETTQFAIWGGVTVEANYELYQSQSFSSSKHQFQWPNECQNPVPELDVSKKGESKLCQLLGMRHPHTAPFNALNTYHRCNLQCIHRKKTKDFSVYCPMLAAKCLLTTQNLTRWQIHRVKGLIKEIPHPHLLYPTWNIVWYWEY